MRGSGAGEIFGEVRDLFSVGFQDELQIVLLMPYVNCHTIAAAAFAGEIPGTGKLHTANEQVTLVTWILVEYRVASLPLRVAMEGHREDNCQG